MADKKEARHAYLEVKDKLLDSIWQENLEVGDKLPTITEIAKKYSVCRETAIRSVSELVEQGILYSKRRTGITVRALPPRKDVKRKTILSIFTRGPLSLPQQLQMAISESLPGWCIFQTQISSAESNNYADDFLDSFINNHKYEVYLLVSVNPKVKAYFQRKKLPCILIGELEEGIDLPNVAHDEYERSYQATRYLLQQGYPEIVFIQYKRKRPGDERRAAAIIAAINENQTDTEVQKPAILSIDSTNKPEGEKIIARFLSEAQFPIGVISCSDYVTCWLLQKAHKMGIDIPSQLGIITNGFTDLPTHSYPMVTSMKPDSARIGFEVVKMLLRITSGYDSGPLHVVIPYEPPYVVPRQTTMNVTESEKNLISLKM